VKAAFPHLACLPIDGIDNVFPLAGVHLLNALKQIQGILCLQLSRSTNLLAHLDLTRRKKLLRLLAAGSAGAVIIPNDFLHVPAQRGIFNV